MSMPAPADFSSAATFGSELARIRARVRRILLSPRAEWQTIDRESENEATLYRSWVVPLVVASALATAIGYWLFGYRTLFTPVGFRFSIGLAFRSFLVNAILGCMGVYLLSLVVDALAPSFGGVQNRIQALKVAAYASTPQLVAGLLGLLPVLAPIAFFLGFYNAWLLYTGLPTLMRAPRARAAGYAGAVFVAGFVLFLVLGQVGKRVLHM